MTEASLSVGFVNWLKHHSKTGSFPVFRDVFSEIECGQGIPDLIGVPCDWKPSPVPWSSGSSKVSLKAVSSVLALFAGRRSHTSAYVMAHSGLSEELNDQVVRVLCTAGLIAKSTPDSLKLDCDLSWMESDLWAFELKIHDWRRALFQSLQYRTFASYEVVIMPSSKKSAIARKLEYFESAGIGVVLFDNQSNHEEVLVRARRNRPTSRQQRVFTMYKLLDKHSREHQPDTSLSMMPSSFSD